MNATNDTVEVSSVPVEETMSHGGRTWLFTSNYRFVGLEPYLRVYRSSTNGDRAVLMAGPWKTLVPESHLEAFEAFIRTKAKSVLTCEGADKIIEAAKGSVHAVVEAIVEMSDEHYLVHCRKLKKPAWNRSIAIKTSDVHPVMGTPRIDVDERARLHRELDETIDELNEDEQTYWPKKS